MNKSELKPQPKPEPQNLKSMCKDIENIVDPQIYAKIRILKCGTVTEADIKAITDKLTNLSLDSPTVENVNDVKKVKKIRKTQGTKVKSEVDSESYGLDKLYNDEDLNTISKVTTIDKIEDAPLVMTVVDESAKNDVSISLDKKFETYGLEDLFAPTEEPPTPAPCSSSVQALVQAPPALVQALVPVLSALVQAPVPAISADSPQHHLLMFFFLKFLLQ